MEIFSYQAPSQADIHLHSSHRKRRCQFQYSLTGFQTLSFNLNDNVIIFTYENLISAAGTVDQVIVNFSERAEEALGKIARAYD